MRHLIDRFLLLSQVRLKVLQVMKQLIAEREWQIEEEHRRALDALKQLQSKCDLQCNTLLKIIEYQGEFALFAQN